MLEQANTIVKPLSWYHVVLTTYGAWLPGDPRAYRTRHHRQHVEGDYKSPPISDIHAFRHQQSKKSLVQPVVELTDPWQANVGKFLVEAYSLLNTYALCIAVNRQHIHVLVKHESRVARKVSGHVKLHVYQQAYRLGWRGKLWAVRSREELVRDQIHQQNAYRYILEHALHGAWVWRNELQLNDEMLVRGIIVPRNPGG